MRSANVHELVLSASARWSKRPVFRHIYGGKVREFAYEDLPRLTYLFAQAFVARGVKEGDRIVLCADNCPEWVIACLSIFRLGAVVVPVDARSRQADIEAVAEKVKPTLFVLGRMQYGLLRDTLDEERVIIIDEVVNVSTADGARANVLFHSVPPDAPALIVFTSGTSGLPKGVVLTHANIVSNVHPIVERFPIESSDKLLSILPLSHMFEFTAGLIAPLVKGACIVFSRLKGPDHLRQVLRTERINALIGVPAIYQNVLKALESKIAQRSQDQQQQVAMARRVVASPVGLHLAPLIMQEVLKEFGGTIKFWAAGGAPLGADVVRGLASFGIPVLAGYGLTEASPIVAANTLSNNRPGSVGKPLRNVEVRIRPLDDQSENASLPAGVDGEILVRAPSVMRGYYEDEAATTEVLRDGWLYTGDVGHLDIDGYLYVTGRIKSIIVTAGGYNIHPEELERALEQSPAIKESSVFGIKTAAGEQPHALIVPSADAAARADDKEYFRAEVAKCLEDLAEYKRLAGFEIYQGELPRTRTNKIQRSKAAEIYESLKENTATASGARDETSSDLDEDGLAVREELLLVANPSTADTLKIENVDARTDICADLGIDSFARLELAVRLEQRLSITLPEEAVNDVQTVGELITLIKSRRRAEGNAPADSKEESGNFDALMIAYSKLAPEHSPQAARLAAAVAPWPHGRPIEPAVEVRNAGWMKVARRSIVIALRGVLKAYNGLERIDRQKLDIEPPYIVAANHTSHVDTAALYVCFPPHLLSKVHPVAASDTFYKSRISAEITSNLLNAVPFERYGNFERSMGECIQVLQRGEILVIFPEGTRSVTGRLGPFRSGVSQLAAAAGCPVIPAYISGGDKVLPKKGRVPKPAKLRVRFGDPLQPPSPGADLQEIQEFTRSLEEAVARLAD